MVASSFALPTTAAPSLAASPVSTSLSTAHPHKTLVLPHLNSLLPSLSSKIHGNLPRRWRSPKAIYSSRSWAPDQAGRKGIWSIRDDLLVPLPSSPYFPVKVQGGQCPPPMVQERFQSRIIRCGGAVDDDMANIIVAQLLYLDAVDPTKYKLELQGGPTGISVIIWAYVYDAG